jgi:hypothetical protein
LATTFTLAQYEALTAAIAQGVRTVKYTDKEITYHSLSEMLNLRNLMARELGLSAKNTRVLGSFSKGLNCNSTGRK